MGQGLLLVSGPHSLTRCFSFLLASLHGDNSHPNRSADHRRRRRPLKLPFQQPRRRHAAQRAAGVVLRPGEESLLPHQGAHPWRRRSSPSSSRSPNAAARSHSGGMQQEEGEAAGAAQRQGDVRRRSHLLQQGHQVHIQAAVPLCAGGSAHGLEVPSHGLCG